MKTNKITIIVLTVLLAAAMIVTAFCVATSGFTKPLVPQSDNAIAVDENGNVMQGDKNYAMPAKMAFSAIALAANPQGVSVTVTATVKPSTASNKSVDWSVMWSDSTNKTTVTDYVNVVPASNGSTTATVTCYKSFTGDILITVTTREGGYSADCIVSFVGVPTAIEVSHATLTPSSGNVYGIGVGVVYDFNISSDNAFGSVGAAYKDYYVTTSAEGTLTVGTLEDDPRGTPKWYNTRSANLSEFKDNILECTVDGDVLHVKLKSSIEGYYTDMKRTGVIKTYHDRVQTVNSACSFQINVMSREYGAGLYATIKIVLDANVVTGVSVNGTLTF